jgi:radical SAM family uncharacterized protein
MHGIISDMESTLADRVENELLPRVHQPAQYIGGEVNQLVRAGDWAAADVRLALAFPDTYTIGMSHLGCQTLYWIANHLPGVCAERVFAPRWDAEGVMRARGIPLFTWDTRQPVRSADLFGISLQYELSFTTVLNLLDLAGIPLRAADRTDADPLVIAGGPQADNPEPLAEFLDLVVIGDGEHALTELLAACRAYKQAGVPRREMILLMARRFPWIYAPSLYAVHYNADGTIADFAPTVAGVPATIARCETPDFETVAFPARPLVPWVEAVHERIAIEIMRGCPNLCRFCHAGYTKRPLRLRSVARIVELAEAAYWATGFEEIGLLSLSTGDYPALHALAEQLNERFAARMVNLSFPSLRVDKMLQHIPTMARTVRKSGLTMAVEAATAELRAAIRKKVTDGNLLDGVRAAFDAGWKRVKLYFMAGFPGERPSDIDGIFDLSYAVSQERRKLGKAPAAVTAAVSWLVPKPFTPLQWAPQATPEYFNSVRTRLYRIQRARRSAVKFSMQPPEQSLLEGVLARGDRRLGPAILDAWRQGARLEGWSECFRYERWVQAFAATGVDPAFYAHRERATSERLPWAHIGQRLSTDYLARSYRDLCDCMGPVSANPGASAPQ